MSITQVGIATVSDELLAYIKDQIRNGTISWSDLSDTPDYTGQDGKFLKAQSGGGASSIGWESLPAAGLNWQTETSDFLAEDKIGILASNGITITLPENPSVGNLVAIADHLSEFDTKPITVAASGGILIEGDSTLILDLRNAYVQLIYDGADWGISQINHPFNIQEITEESFPGGSLSYTLSRVPPTRAALLVTVSGKVMSSNSYSVLGNVLSLNTVPSDTLFIRHIGIPSAVKVSDTPVGAMLYFPNGEPVDGWLDCTGGTIGKAVYPDLVRYLSKDPDAETALLPDSRGNFIRSWDHGSGADAVSPTVIPNVLKTNEWGRWLETTEPSTASNLWDGSASSYTAVNVANGYIGYAFDAPVSVTSLDITTSDPVSSLHVPTSMQIKASEDGVTWVEASIASSGPFQNRTVRIDSTTNTPYRYWAVFGTGGQPYPDDTSKYWGAASLVFTGFSTNRVIGGFQDQAVGPMDVTLDGVPAAPSSVQSGTGATSLVVGGSGTSGGGGSDTRPNNQAYVLRIKAFHYQSGSLADSNVTALRGELSRLSTRVNDGTSYVSATAPDSPSENARWYDTTSGRTYLWFNDGDSYQWVDDSPQATSSSKESINGAPVLAVGSSTARALNQRFADIYSIEDFGSNRNSTDDSKSAFDTAGSGPIMIPHGSYVVSSGDYSGNVYFSFGPVTISGSATGIVIKDLLA